MSAGHLALVGPTHERGSIAERIECLRSETKALAREQIEALNAALEQVCSLAHEISEGGEVYPVGTRELAVKLCETSGKQARVLTAILERSRTE